MNHTMNTAAAVTRAEALPRLIERAAAALAKATSAAEVLEARDAAALAYDAAKATARFAKAKQAHDQIIAACHRAQADALDIEAAAKCRLADEYDAAQERGEVVGPKGGNPDLPNRSTPERLASVEDIGLTRKQVHEARKIRDAEKQQPGVIRKVLDKRLAAGQEPTRAHVNRVVDEVLSPKPPPPQMTRAQKLEQEQLDHVSKHAQFVPPESDQREQARIRELEMALAQALARNVELEAQVAKLAAGNAALAAELEAHDRARTAATPPPRRLTPDEIAKYVPPLPKTVDGLRYAAEAKGPEAKIAALEEKLKQRDRRITKLERENALQEEIAARDRRIKALTTEIQNLKATSRMQHEFYETERERKGIMPPMTYTTLVKCLHPDKPPPTQEQRQEAFGLLSQWKQASGKTRRT